MLENHSKSLILQTEFFFFNNWIEINYQIMCFQFLSSEDEICFDGFQILWIFTFFQKAQWYVPTSSNMSDCGQ